MTDFSGQILADKYRIDSLMRNSDLGSLYHGTHLTMEKPVAIKILPAALAVDDNISKRFLAEAKTLSRLSHPNILNVTDQGSDKTGIEYIVFESAEGQSLKDAVRTSGKFSLERANRITRQIAAALSVAHTKGIVHKNLTAENILLSKTADDTDLVKVLNFGIASADEDANNEEVSNSSAEYFSPEQCSGEGEIDARSDIYSLGIILYEMLAGEVPFTAEKTNDVMLKHVQEPPLPLSAFRMDVPNEVSQIILTALAKNPDSRYQNVNELAAELNRETTSTIGATAATVGAYPNLSQPVSTIETANGDAHNNLWKTAFIVLAGIAVLGSFFIYMTQVKQTNPQTGLMSDANSLPVQPVNPPVGSTEQSLANMGAYNPGMMSNSNMTMLNGMPQPQIMPGGDGYDAWRNGVKPPPGAPQQDPYGVPMYAPPTGQTYDGSINPNSIFMPPDYVIVQKNANTNANTQPKKNANANVNTQPQTAPANTSTTKPSPTPPAANTATPTTQPKTNPAPKSSPTTKASPKGDNPPSGKQSDTQD